MSTPTIGDPKKAYYGSVNIRFPLDDETVERLAIAAYDGMYPHSKDSATAGWNGEFVPENARERWRETVRCVVAALMEETEK